VLIRRRDVRLRERRIDPYKYPTVDKERKEEKNPKTKQRPRNKTRAKQTIKKVYTERGISYAIAFIPAENDPKISIHRSRHLRSFPSLPQNLLEKQRQTVGTGAKRESRRKGIKQAKVTNNRSSQSFAIVSNASNKTSTRFLLLVLSQLNGFYTVQVN
jgi:hypothetical protein